MIDFARTDLTVRHSFLPAPLISWELLLPLLSIGIAVVASGVLSMLAHPEKALTWFGCDFPVILNVVLIVVTLSRALEPASDQSFSVFFGVDV